MEAAKHGKGNDLPCLRMLHLRWDGNRLANAPSTALRVGLMGSGVVEEAAVLPHHFGQMVFVEDEHVVETLTV